MNKKNFQNRSKKCTSISFNDHRVLGKQLDLYHIQNEAPGMIFWHKNGWIIFQELKNFIRLKLKKYSYEEVNSPIMIDKSLWEKTEHLKYYKDAIFNTTSENKKYCIKPMNCPAHIQIFNQTIKSYRMLPIRIAEFGICHRNEFSGSLNGLIRVRNFTQDDAHIFCTTQQIRTEVQNCLKMIYEIYKIFGFKNILVKLSTRPKNSIGNNTLWDIAEKDLKIVLKENNIQFDYKPEEGAFYGPKIEFILYDCLKREWQCGTIQLDFFLPYRLNAFYIDKNNKKQTPVMIHRAILGSLERFIAILLEEYSGFFPTWLAPVQIIIINVHDKHIKYVKKLKKQFNKIGFRTTYDLRDEKVGFKIREHTLRRIPYILICGDKEIKNNTISIRTYRGKNLGIMNIQNFINKLKKEISKKCHYQLEE